MDFKSLDAEFERIQAIDNFSEHFEFTQKLLEFDNQEMWNYHFSLMNFQDNKSLYYRVRAAFHKRGMQVGPFLVEKFKTERSPIQKSNAIQLIGNIRYTAALPLIRDHLYSTERSIRYACIISLGWMGETQDIARLVNAYDLEKDPELRGYTITALRQIFSKRPAEKEKIVHLALGRVIAETDGFVQSCIIISFQDILGKKFGLKENIDERMISGDIAIAWQKFLKFATRSV